VSCTHAPIMGLKYMQLLRLKRRCGARTRKGTACLRKAMRNGCFPNHGGLSTGPKTAEGWGAHPSGIAGLVGEKRAGEAQG
jgi:hypothetical protein